MNLFDLFRPSIRNFDALEINDATKSLRRNNFAVVRGAAPIASLDLGEQLAARLIETRDPGNNLLKLISSENNETDFMLVRKLLTPRVTSIARAYFKASTGTADFVLPYIHLVVRHFDGQLSRKDTVIPYHQDAFGFPTGARMLNCWTLLHPGECGDTSPGLDFAPVVLRKLLPIEKAPASPTYGFLETNHRQLAGFGEPITPSVHLGDVLMFNEFALHRTSLKNSLRARVSAEIRLLAATPEILQWVGAEATAHVIGNRIRWTSRWQLNDRGRFDSLAYAESDLG